VRFASRSQQEQLSRRISRHYSGRTLDVVWVLAGHDYREVVFSPRPELRGRGVLVVDAVLNGVASC